MFSLPSTVLSTTNTHDLNMVRCRWKKKQLSCQPPSPIHHSISHPSWKKFLQKWYILMLATSLVFSSLLPLPSTVLSTTNSHVLNMVRQVESIKNFHVNQYHHSISGSIWKKFNWCDTSSLVFSILLSLPSTVSSTAKSHVFNVVRDIGHIKSIKTFQNSHPYHCISHPCKRKFQLMWYILMSGISLVFSSLLSLPSTVPSTSRGGLRAI